MRWSSQRLGSAIAISSCTVLEMQIVGRADWSLRDATGGVRKENAVSIWHQTGGTKTTTLEASYQS